MAKVTLTIEDKWDGTVAYLAEPSGVQIIESIKERDMTAAEAYAMKAINQIEKESKSRKPTIPIFIPRIGR